jgi:hypothetical protein
VGTQPVEQYSREVEAYLTRKNDGHLVRIVGPAFDLVNGWARAGIPLKIVYQGVDRYFARYYRKGARRRPVRIEFCDADVLDVFDEWRRAVGLTSAGPNDEESPEGPRESESPHRGPSLPEHLQRALLRLTDARARGTLDPRADDLLDHVARELEASRQAAGGVRGPARLALIARLSDLDTEMLDLMRSVLDADAQVSLAREAEAELTAYRDRMRPEAFEAACRAAANRLIRERFGLPTLNFR